jgi:hypothetical protein
MAMSRKDWTVMRLARDFHTGEYLVDKDPIYRHRCGQEQLEMEKAELAAKAPGSSHVRINQADAQWVNSLQGAVNPQSGQRYFDDPKTREGIERARMDVFAGKAIDPNVRAQTDAVLAANSKGNQP